MSNTIKTIIVVVLILAVIAAAAFLVYSNVKTLQSNNWTASFDYKSKTDWFAAGKMIGYMIGIAALAGIAIYIGKHR